MSLIELLVVVALLSLVTVGLFAFLNQTLGVTSSTQKNVNSEEDGQLALRSITQNLRGANPIKAACPPSPVTGHTWTAALPAGSANCISFEAKTAPGTNGCPKSVFAYGVVNNVLIEDRVDLNSACAVSRRWTGRPLLKLKSGSPGVFSYYNDGVATTPTAANVTNITSVKVDVVVEYQRGRPSIPLSSVATLRNNR